MRGGTHFGDSGDALFGDYTPETSIQIDAEKFEVPIPGPRGVFAVGLQYFKDML